MINSLKSSLGRNITNAKGWRTSRKIVVIESDDWGSIRMPSKESYNKLIQKGIRVDKSLYDSLDSLEKKEDLVSLFDVLQDNVSINSKPIFTFNTIIQNPDFNKIREDNFENFHGINLFDSYNAYYGEDLRSLWEKSINEKLMLPQYHAREHLNAYLWIKDLKKGVSDTKIAFDLNFFGLKTETSSKLRKHYLATYFSETLDEFNFVKESLYDGVGKFENIFGFQPKSFIASNYSWPQQLEEELSILKFKSIQSQRKQIHTDFITGKIDYVPHHTGQKNKLEQCYTVRNVIFEPYLDQNKNWAELAFKQIENAFLWGTPAIISSHRVNYVSNMSQINRDSSLKHLDTLLKKINLKFPDVEFMSSSQLADLIIDQKEN
tara:strand:+ start:151 stop:1281 length:1131 start_codon:yes stop_codon:yes gene_type:complete